MPGDELTNLTRVANLGTVLSDMPIIRQMEDLRWRQTAAFTVDRFAEVQVVGKIPVTTNTPGLQRGWHLLYRNEYGTGKIWQFTLDSLKTEPPVKYDLTAMER